VEILLNVKNHTTQNTTHIDTLNLPNTIFSIWIALNFQKKTLTWYFFLFLFSAWKYRKFPWTPKIKLS